MNGAQSGSRPHVPHTASLWSAVVQVGASRLAEDAVAGRVPAADELIDADMLDVLMARVDESGLRLTGQDGFLPALIKAVRRNPADEAREAAGRAAAARHAMAHPLD